MSLDVSDALSKYGRDALLLRKRIACDPELSLAGGHPTFSYAEYADIHTLVQSVQHEPAQHEEQLKNIRNLVDECAFKLYGVEGVDQTCMGQRISIEDENAHDVLDDSEDGSARLTPSFVTPLQTVRQLVSHALGCVVGRWDIRYFTGVTAQPEFSGPFDPLPACATGNAPK